MIAKPMTQTRPHRIPRNLTWGLILMLALAYDATAQDQEGVWYVHIASGNAYNMPLPLRIEQDGEPTLNHRARYATRAFDTDYHAPYYSWRVGHTRGEKGWDVEHLHHKIVLENPPSAVQHFAITHGFNFLFVNRSWIREPWDLRLGSGLIIARPEITVREREIKSGGDIGDGYYLSGLALHGELQRRWPLDERFFAALQLKIIGAYAEVPIAGGKASLWHLSLHGLAGIGLWL